MKKHTPMMVSCYHIWTSNAPEYDEWQADQPARVYVDGVEIPWPICFDIEEGWVEHLVLHPVTKRPRTNKVGIHVADRIRGRVTVHRESDIEA